MGDWRPPSGGTALIEPVGDSTVCLTGIVLDEEDEDVVVVDLGGSPPPREPTRVFPWRAGSPAPWAAT